VIHSKVCLIALCYVLISVNVHKTCVLGSCISLLAFDVRRVSISTFGLLMTFSKFNICLDNDQLDAHLLYFTIYLLHSSTCFEHYMLIIRRLNCIDAVSGIMLSVSGRPVRRLRENCVLSQPVHRMATD